jgi:hypothetical protein
MDLDVTEMTLFSSFAIESRSFNSYRQNISDQEEKLERYTLIDVATEYLRD